MLPVIAIVGRPNVGKSTLFNQLTRTRSALVADYPGLTRDRIYGLGQVGDRPYIVIDTGGLTESTEAMGMVATQHVWEAVSEADAILFVLDARFGLHELDRNIANQLRTFSEKPIYVVANKVDGLDTDSALLEFYALGLGVPQAISASHGRGIPALMTTVLSILAKVDPVDSLFPKESIKIAVVGRPNVGKSTLVNTILGEERVVVFDEPGTTRDSIFIPFSKKGKPYVLIDTAGVRRRSKVSDMIEKFSVIKTLQAIESSHVVVFIFDATEGVVTQDLDLLDFVIEAGRALVLAINKSDAVLSEQREAVKKQLSYRLAFVNFAKTHFISALKGTGISALLQSVDQAFRAASKELSTSLLTRALERIVAKHQPPLVKGRRIKLRYAHAGGRNPPVIVIHGNQTEDVPLTYRRYLMNAFREWFRLEGTPVRLEFRTAENPYVEKKTTSRPRHTVPSSRKKGKTKREK